MLSTKLYAPPLRDKLVNRERLIDKLNQGIGRKLTLVSAPAGYGKTTAVLKWLRETEVRYAWLSLDKNDNDSSRFLAYLVAALQKVDSKLGLSISKLMGEPQQPSFEILLELLVDDLAKGEEKITLILDDYHLISNKIVHSGIGFLVEYKPPSLHLVLITREDPRLPLAKLRVRNESVEIRASDLLFRQEETEEFMRSTMGLKLNDKSVKVLTDRTEGWVAGLQLAAISLQGKDDTGIDSFIQSFGGSHRYVIDYLMEEVLQGQPQELRLFLRQTALLERFCPEVCAAVTRCGNCREVLNYLEDLGLFLIPLDDSGNWYRYHHLFATVLSIELEQKEREEVFSRAAVWFAEQGLREEGAGYALASGNMDLAGRLIAQAASEFFQRGEMTTLVEWTDKLPVEVLLKEQELAVYRAWALFYTGQGERASNLIAGFELQYPSLTSELVGRLTALKGWLDYSSFGPYGLDLAKQALQYLEQKDNFQLMALLLLGEYQRNLGDASGSMHTFRLAFELSRQADYSYSSIGALVELAVNLELTGHREEAVNLCREAIDRYTKDQEPIPLLGFVYTRLGAFHYAAHQLELAYSYLEKGVELCRRLTTDRVMGGEGKITLGNVQLALGQMDLARVLYAMNKRKEAWGVLAEVQELVQRSGIHPFIGKIGALASEFLIREGALLEAAARLAEIGLSSNNEPDPAREEEYLILGAALLGQRKIEEAKCMLGKMENSALAGGRQARLISIYILLALAEQRLGSPSSALEYMEKALRIAVPGRYLRPFIDAGGNAVELLRKSRSAAPEFVGAVLAELGGFEEVKVNARKQATLVEGLSEREVEILRLVALGLSNGEIATRLFITPGTTKWHLNNIFSKLGVNSRTKAVSLARELNLL